jgi:hypothetical protein
MPTAPKIHSVMLSSLLISASKSEKMPIRKQADRAFIRSFKTFFITANLKIDLLFKTDLFDQDVTAFFPAVLPKVLRRTYHQGMQGTLLLLR